jgi:hypothetical protein
MMAPALPESSMTRTGHLGRLVSAAATWLAVAGGVVLLSGGLALLLSSVLALVGCDGGRTCYVDADCASGQCGADGRCVLAATDGGPGDGGLSDGGLGDVPAPGDGLRDGGPAPGDAGGDGAPVTCNPDDDGLITRVEVPLQAGLHATFRVATGATVDMVGTQVGGVRTWDLTNALAGDHALLAETRDFSGAWYAADFVGATYAARLSDGNELLGVFEVTADALLLRGVVSPDDGLTRTELTYNPAVKVLSFPLQAGTTFSTTSMVTGQASGVWSAYSEKYESQVDAEGDLKTPYSTFHVLRVRTLMTRTVGLLVTTSRTFAFVTDCFGTVATVRSQDNESAVEFTQAAEVWRLSP